MEKYWEAKVGDMIFTAPTLKALANKLQIKPSMIEGVYYRKRLSDTIQIRKILKETEPFVFNLHNEPFVVNFN